MITLDYLKSVLAYDRNSGHFTWLCDVGNGVCKGDIAGSGLQGEYIYIGIKSDTYSAHSLAWFYETGAWAKQIVDHIDLVKSNNAFANLREANKSENARNCGVYANNCSGFKGVTWHKRTKKWRATCTIGMKSRHLGYFMSAEDASVAYQTFAKLTYGKFYNTPKTKELV